jgi:delta-aminolevulinic acid dehydratase/porphobilinogen synthase
LFYDLISLIIVECRENPDIDNDKSVARLAEMALSHAKAGADMVAPSDMMDGSVDYSDSY